MVNKAILARYLGPAGFGLYALFFKLCNISGMLSQLGTNAEVVKLVGISFGNNRLGEVKGILLTTYRIIIVSSLFTAFIIWLAEKPIALDVFNSLQMLAIMPFVFFIIPAYNIFIIVKETFRGMQDFRVSSFLPVLQQAVLFLLLVFLCVSGFFSLGNVLFSLGAGFFISFTAGIFLLHRKLGTNLKPGKVKASGILSESVHMMITRGSLVILSTTDVYVLGIYTGMAEVGIYSAVSSLAVMTVFSLNIINQVIPSMFAYYSNQKDAAATEYVARFASTLGMFFSLPVLLIFFVFGKSILVLLFGSHYAGGVTILYILLFSQMVNSLTGSCGYLLQMTGFHAVLTRISVLSGIINLVLNILFVKHWGKEGVAVATALSLSLQNIISLIMARKKHGIWTVPSWKLFKEIIETGRKYICTFYSR